MVSLSTRFGSVRLGRGRGFLTMVLRTTVRDCLFLNWALPASALPPLPEPLRYELHPAEGAEWGFASALLFFQESLRLRALPFVKLTFPQLDLRYLVTDDDGLPAVFFRRMYVPAWVLPAARLVGRQPVRPARLSFPRPSEDLEAESWSWTVGGSSGLVVTAERGAPRPGPGPRFSSWEATVRYFRERRRGYAEAGGGLRRIETTQPRIEVWPVRAEISEPGPIARDLGLAGADPAAAFDLHSIHSSWLCPEIPMIFHTAPVLAVEEPVRRSVPAAG